MVKKGFELYKNVSETDKYTSNATGKTHHVNHKVNNDDNCPVYLLPSKCCGKQLVTLGTDRITKRRMIESMLAITAVCKKISTAWDSGYWQNQLQQH